MPHSPQGPRTFSVSHCGGSSGRGWLFQATQGPIWAFHHRISWGLCTNSLHQLPAPESFSFGKTKISVLPLDFVVFACLPGNGLWCQLRGRRAFVVEYPRLASSHSIWETWVFISLGTWRGSQDTEEGKTLKPGWILALPITPMSVLVNLSLSSAGKDLSYPVDKRVKWDSTRKELETLASFPPMSFLLCVKQAVWELTWDRALLIHVVIASALFCSKNRPSWLLMGILKILHRRQCFSQSLLIHCKLKSRTVLCHSFAHLMVAEYFLIVTLLLGYYVLATISIPADRLKRIHDILNNYRGMLMF